MRLPYLPIYVLYLPLCNEDSKGIRVLCAYATIMSTYLLVVVGSVPGQIVVSAAAIVVVVGELACFFFELVFDNFIFCFFREVLGYIE